MGQLKQKVDRALAKRKIQQSEYNTAWDRILKMDAIKADKYKPPTLTHTRSARHYE